jgi:hypothetical protein
LVRFVGLAGSLTGLVDTVQHRLGAGTDKEVTLLKPDNQFYKDFALDCSRQQIAVDLFLFSPHYTDVATLSTAPRGLEG